jgi:hypothetical protein
MSTTLSTGRAKRIEKFVERFADEQIDMDYESRRTCPRYRMGETVDVLLDSYEMPAELVTASGRDISTGGIGLYTHRPIRPGTEMIISINNGQERFISKAVAIHSTLSVGLFKIGARFIV